MMAADPLTDAVSTRICQHMNDDHAEAVLAYAQHYGGVSAPTAARMCWQSSPRRWSLKWMAAT